MQTCISASALHTRACICNGLCKTWHAYSSLVYLLYVILKFSAPAPPGVGVSPDAQHLGTAAASGHTRPRLAGGWPIGGRCGCTPLLTDPGYVKAGMEGRPTSVLGQAPSPQLVRVLCCYAPESTACPPGAAPNGYAERDVRSAASGAGRSLSWRLARLQPGTRRDSRGRGAAGRLGHHCQHLQRGARRHHQQGRVGQ